MKTRLALMGFLAVASLGTADELLVGGGYGDQQSKVFRQKNAVVDVIYDFYDIHQSPDWKLSLGIGVSWLWDDFDNDSIFMSSVYPLLRYYLLETEYFQTYAFATAGLSYLSEPGLGQRVLGGRIAFSDFLGAGAYVGRQRNWSMSLCWRHVSNGGMYQPNRGIDIPVYIIIGRCF